MSSIDIELINREVTENAREFAKKCDDIYEKKLEETAGILSEVCDRPVFASLAGPTASGKTTTALKLTEYLRNRGVYAVTISLDDYFLGIENTPRLEDGSYDFESIHALDLELINKNFKELSEKREANIPQFNFLTGCRSEAMKKIKIPPCSVVFIEGINALHTYFSDMLKSYKTKKIYISVEGGVTKSGNSLIFPWEIRLIRRIIRDHQFRASRTENTFSMWGNVRQGEHKYIFPFKDTADIKIDSFLPYEMAVYRNIIEGYLNEVESDSVFYSESRLLLDKMSGFKKMPVSLVSSTSLIREFIGDM